MHSDPMNLSNTGDHGNIDFVPELAPISLQGGPVRSVEVRLPCNSGTFARPYRVGVRLGTQSATHKLGPERARHSLDGQSIDSQRFRRRAPYRLMLRCHGGLAVRLRSVRALRVLVWGVWCACNFNY